ncbi:MAG: long-chain N-acyl amino acid synthase [Betaproteobacteria bacterium CG2_30_68_42]|nr:MAG: long-chain N-acyl amino acid synthase [Betaproteobacteria bacterium CG2_30_68_42]
MSNPHSLREPSLPLWMRTLAEVTVMDADRLQPMCIETAEPPRTRELARTRDKFRIKLAGSGDVRKEASVLIEKMYAWRGYAGVGSLDQAPNRITLNAEYNGSIYGTLTVNVDSPLGLACEAIYPEIVRSLRAQGRKLCEFGRFAVEHSVRSKRLLATLFHMIYIYANRLHGCTDALIEVNPRHVEFYRRYLEFEVCGEERMCARVNAPAVLLRMDFAAKEPRMRELAGRWRSLPAEKSFYKYFMPEKYEAAVLARLARRPDKEVYAS